MRRSNWACEPGLVEMDRVREADGDSCQTSGRRRGGLGFKKGLRGGYNVFADIFKAFSLIVPNYSK